MTSIRAAVPADFSAIYALLCELEEKTLPENEVLSVFEDNLTNPGIHYLLAEQNDKIIGFGSIHIQKLLHHHGNVGELQELVVAAPYQGAGVGGVLWNALKRIAEENECGLLEVCCNRKREKSHPFYEKQGMKKSHFKFTYSQLT